MVETQAMPVLLPTAALAVPSRCAHGEGVLWCDRRAALLWIDIAGLRLWMHVPADGTTRNWALPDRPGCIGLTDTGALLVVLAKDIHLADLDAALADPLVPLPLRHLARIEPENPHTRSNDGRADRGGNFVFGTMNEHPSRAPDGRFYQYSTRHGLRALALPGATIPNSICFSPDGGTLYFCDSLQATIQCCDYDAGSAAVSAPRPFAEVAGAEPDGSIIDAHGNLWNAQWGAARVVRYTPQGQVDRIVPVPVPQPSCCAIGGAALDTLYVISSRLGLDQDALERAPESGSLFAAPLDGPAGLPESRVQLT